MSLDHAGKQLYVVLLPEDGNEERKFLEQGMCVNIMKIIHFHWSVINWTIEC